MNLSPQPGPQSQFLSSAADIVIYGGGAGGGKTFGLLMEPLRHIIRNPLFNTVFFRRTTVQIRNPGALWDESMKMYAPTGARSFPGILEWRWPNGGTAKMAHMEHEGDKLAWQGSQIALICFDELTHFTSSQFWYLVSRNRSISGVRPYIRATCNPDPDSWVKELIAWFLDEGTGYPIPERCGELRWFARVNDEMIWANSPEELLGLHPGTYDSPTQPKSITFIPARLSDNPALIKVDPGYLANLQALPRVERERLLGGNWKVRLNDFPMFPDSITRVREIPDDVIAWTRRWDLAATRPSEVNPDPDATTSVLMGMRKNGRIIIADATWMRDEANEVRKALVSVRDRDAAMFRKPRVKLVLPIDPGQAGKDQFKSLSTMLAGTNVHGIRETGDKVTRAEPVSAMWQAGNIDILEAPWNKKYLNEMSGFPSFPHDDYPDATSGAFNDLTAKMPASRRFRALGT